MSIYEEKRLVLPNEVWNFWHGDGIEKALLFADYLVHKDYSSTVSIAIDGKKVLLTFDGREFHFTSYKNLSKSIQITGNNYKII